MCFHVLARVYLSTIRQDEIDSGKSGFPVSVNMNISYMFPPECMSSVGMERK